MKKGLKITLIIIGVVVGIILLDTIQALVFNNNPIIGTQTKCRSKEGIFVTTYHCESGKNITKLKDSTCSTETVCKETIIKDYYIEAKDLQDKINEYFSSEGADLSNYVYSAIDGNNKVIVGLIDNTEDNQNDFLDKVFTKCCGVDYINFIKEHNLIEFKESKEIFEAKIIEAKENSITVEVLKDCQSFKEKEKVVVKITRPTNGTNDFYVKGNNVRITFSGMVETSKPPQIGAVKVELIN